MEEIGEDQARSIRVAKRNLSAAVEYLESIYDDTTREEALEMLREAGRIVRKAAKMIDEAVESLGQD